MSIYLKKRVASRWLRAKIVLPPRDLGVFIKLLERKLKPIEDHILKIRDIDKKYNRDFSGDNPMEHFDLYGNSWHDFSYSATHKTKPKYSSRHSSRIAEALADIKETVALAKKQNDAREMFKLLGYATNSLDSLAEDLNKAKLYRYESNTQSFEDWLEEEEYYSGEGVPFPSYDEQRLILDYDDVLSKASPILKEAIKRINRLSEQAYGKLYDHDWRPPSENVETLYHASINAVPLLRTGFSLKVPGTEGIGGAQGDKSGKPAISFTSDLYVANQVARALKEAIMIAKGKLKFHQVRDWAEREGILKKVLGSFKSNHRMTKDSVLNTFNLYRIYLALSRRYDPLFFGIDKAVLNKWKQVNESNVGVVVADVDMDDPNIRYLTSMQEYRVPPEAVIKIKKVIK